MIAPLSVRDLAANHVKGWDVNDRLATVKAAGSLLASRQRLSSDFVVVCSGFAWPPAWEPMGRRQVLFASAGWETPNMRQQWAGLVAEPGRLVAPWGQIPLEVVLAGAPE